MDQAAVQRSQDIIRRAQIEREAERARLAFSRLRRAVEHPEVEELESAFAAARNAVGISPAPVAPGLAVQAQAHREGPGASEEFAAVLEEAEARLVALRAGASVRLRAPRKNRATTGGASAPPIVHPRMPPAEPERADQAPARPKKKPSKRERQRREREKAAFRRREEAEADERAALLRTHPRLAEAPQGEPEEPLRECPLPPAAELRAKPSYASVRVEARRGPEAAPPPTRAPRRRPVSERRQRTLTLPLADFCEAVACEPAEGAFGGPRLRSAGASPSHAEVV